MNSPRVCCHGLRTVSSVGLYLWVRNFLPTSLTRVSERARYAVETDGPKSLIFKRACTFSMFGMRLALFTQRVWRFVPAKRLDERFMSSSREGGALD